jgi:2-keto-4-pentenoate hydratase/2-oxohepta-3-ene-1,7-dioic acid hydratase in catechol pathway
MKLVRYGKAGKEKPGLIDADGNLRDLSARISDITPDQLSGKSLAKLQKLNPARLPLVKGKPRFGPPLTGVGNFIAIGLNYTDHAAETGHATPAEPVIFSKHTSCISGPNDDVVLPKNSTKTDWEVEIGFVIGTEVKSVAKSKALSHVAGYFLCNDVSERENQIERGGQWVKGKSHDTYGPIGPWLVTRDEIPNPQNLNLWCDINGKRMQDGTTKNMIFPISFIVHYLSQFMTLKPGDIVITGTPAGVGLGMKPPVFVKPGDVMELGVNGLGTQRQSVVRGKV